MDTLYLVSAIFLFTATGGGLFDCFTDFASVLLKLTQQFLGLAFNILKTVVSELAAFLFQLAFGDVAVAFDFQCCHNILRFRFLNNSRVVWRLPFIFDGNYFAAIS
jgi:hypothetical protein